MMEIRRFDPHTMTEAEWDALHQSNIESSREFSPEDPLPVLEDLQLMWRHQPPSLTAHRWGIWKGDRLIGRGNISIWTEETNQHLAFFGIYITPACRRQGLGRALLAHIVEAARAAGRTTLQTGTSDTVPDGERFLEHIGAERGMVMHSNQLAIAEVDRAKMAEWVARGPRRAPGFALEFVNGTYPERDLEGICRVFDAINDAPRGDLDMEDQKTTPERLREWDENNKHRGFERWSIFARDLATDTIAGWTEVLYNPRQPTILWQMGTGVLPEYRGRDLGRWMKAAMVEKVIRDRPDVVYIRTGNADNNAPMLRINHEMGFKHRVSDTAWQVSCERVEQYLAQSRP